MRALLLTLTMAAVCGQGLTLRDLPYLASRQTLATGCSQYTTAETAVFDGSAGDVIYYDAGSGALNGIANGKSFTFSTWVKFDGNGTEQKLFIITASGGGNMRINISRNSANRFSLVAQNSSGGTILSATSDSSPLVASSWIHIYATVDMANSSNRHAYVNGSEVSMNWSTYTDDTIQMNVAGTASPLNAIGVNGDLSNDRLSGALSELWFDDSYFDDVTKFYCSGRPANLGSDGSTPTGSPPVVYLSRNGSGNNWRVDSSGNGNTFTVNGGTLGTTTSP